MCWEDVGEQSPCVREIELGQFAADVLGQI